MTETQTVDLAAWLTAIWDEEEQLAMEIGQPDGFYPEPYNPGSPMHHESVLARIAADRKILALHFEEWQTSKTDPPVTYPVCHTCWGEWPCETVRLLASPCKGREGWQEEWAHE